MVTGSPAVNEEASAGLGARYRRLIIRQAGFAGVVRACLHNACMAARVFISFDYDHDDDLKTLLVGQAKNPDSPFEITDASVKYHLTGDWEAKVKGRIDRADQVIVICGHHTDTATGVAKELTMTQALKKPYFLLKGRATGTNKRPTTATSADKMYDWTWPNLKLLIKGSR